MTREAKIGLLVALAFILVIGILLSDHVTSATRPASAALAMIEGNIRDSTNTPGGAVPPATAPRLPGDEPPPAETTTYVHPPAAPPQGASGEISVGIASPPPGQEQPLADPITPEIDWTNPGTENPTDALTTEQQQLQAAANEHGQTLIPVNDGRGGAASDPAPSSTGVKEYTIQPNDSLSKITAKFLGRYNPANEEIIFKLNPKLRANPNRIIVGETCVVPATASAIENLRAAVAPPANQHRNMEPPRNRRPERAVEPPARAGASTKTYTVKDGDTLWSIAQSQLGSGARHKDILKLNADKIDSADEIEVGMKLKLPS